MKNKKLPAILVTIALSLTTLQGCGFLNDYINGDQQSVSNKPIENEEEEQEEIEQEPEDLDEENKDNDVGNVILTEQDYENKFYEKIEDLCFATLSNNLKNAIIDKCELLKFSETGDLYFKICKYQKDAIVYNFMKISTDLNFNYCNSYEKAFNIINELDLTDTLVEITSNIEANIQYSNFMRLRDEIYERSKIQDGVILNIENFKRQENGEYTTKVLIYKNNSIYNYEVVVQDGNFEGESYLDRCAAAFASGEGIIYKAQENNELSPLFIGGKEIKGVFKNENIQVQNAYNSSFSADINL